MPLVLLRGVTSIRQRCEHNILQVSSEGCGMSVRPSQMEPTVLHTRDRGCREEGDRAQLGLIK